MTIMTKKINTNLRKKELTKIKKSSYFFKNVTPKKNMQKKLT